MASTAPGADAVWASARSALATPDVADPLVRERGTAGAPIAIETPPGVAGASRPVGWFVPVIVDDLIAGFFVFDHDGALRRWSTFQRHPGDLKDCPAAASWLSPAVIIDTARRSGVAGEPGVPYLSYDRVPDRLAWIVPFPAAAVYVAGAAFWRAPAPL